MGEEEDVDVEIDFSKKKKKKKQQKEEEKQQQLSASDDEQPQDVDFSSKKKKKKKKNKEKTNNHSDDEDQDQEDQELGIDKLKQVSLKDNAHNGDDDGEDDESEKDFVSIPADREYKYQDLLDRMYSLLTANNPELAGDRKRFLMKPPQVVREGSKKVVVINFGDICKTLNRSADHVFAFMLAEMGTTGSIDASNRMVIKGRFTPKAVEQIIRRYVIEYVSCASCKTPNTTLQKSNRLYFMHCNNCGASRSVTPIKTGFVAISRSARRAKRAA